TGHLVGGSARRQGRVPSSARAATLAVDRRADLVVGNGSLATKQGGRADSGRPGGAWNGGRGDPDSWPGRRRSNGPRAAHGDRESWAVGVHGPGSRGRAVAVGSGRRRTLRRR